ncbi:MAG: hypothetical protein ACREQV_10135 [Candidatus Binatia bacterium]
MLQRMTCFAVGIAAIATLPIGAQCVGSYYPVNSTPSIGVMVGTGISVADAENAINLWSEDVPSLVEK